MLNNYFKEKSPYVFKYFSTVFELIKENKRQFPQGIIFEGEDTKLQFLFSIELARILNCKNNQDKNCNCPNCKWIKTHSHPAVNYVSQIHFKSEDDTTKTIISTKQASEIENSLKLSSDYHRFFIFFSSGKYEYNSDELIGFDELSISKDIDFSIKPLDFKTFHPSTLNALLKSIEEPPKNTTFVFLTKSRENILSTIVSRCLTFKLSSNSNKSTNSNNSLFDFYPNINPDNIFEISANLSQFAKENNTEIETLLNNFANHLKNLLICNPNASNKINNDIKIIGQIIKYSRANINEDILFDTLLLKLYRGY